MQTKDTTDFVLQIVFHLQHHLVVKNGTTHLTIIGGLSFQSWIKETVSCIANLTHTSCIEVNQAIKAWSFRQHIYNLFWSQIQVSNLFALKSFTKILAD